MSTNIMNIAAYVKKFWFFFFFIFVGFFLFILNQILPRQSTPPPIPPINPTPITGAYSSPNRYTPVTYSGSPLSPPESLPLYKTSPTDPQQYAQTLANNLGLDPHPQSQVIWTKENRALNLIRVVDTIVYTAIFPPSDNRGIDLNRAISTANQFITDLGLDKPTIDATRVLLINDIEYLDHTPQTNLPADEATLAVIPYNYSLNNLPSYYNDLLSGSLAIVVDTQYRVIKADLTPPPTNLIQAASSQVLSFESALEKIQNGQFTYLTIFSNDPLQPRPPTPSQLTLNNSEIQYRLNPQDGLIIPYYYFSGTSITNNQTYEIELITPAI